VFFTEDRTITCFLCLGEKSLPFEKRINIFHESRRLDEAF
jgi:hypothetical protein